MFPLSLILVNLMVLINVLHTILMSLFFSFKNHLLPITQMILKTKKMMVYGMMKTMGMQVQKMRKARRFTIKQNLSLIILVVKLWKEAKGMQQICNALI